MRKALTAQNLRRIARVLPRRAAVRLHIDHLAGHTERAQNTPRDLRLRARIAEHLSARDIIVTRYGDEMGAFWAPIVNFYVRHVAKLVPKYYLPGVIPFKKLLKIGRKLPFTRYDAKPDEMAMLQYTGGTTGVAKGAMLSHANLLANATQINLWIVGGNIGPGDVIITALPLYHIFCCTINSLGFSSCGVHSVLVTNPRDIKSFLTILRRHPPTMLTGVNTLFKTLLNNPAFRRLDFSRLRYVIAGGMPLEKAVSDDWQALTGNVIVEGYGLTETSPLVCVNHMDTATYNGTIGYPMPGRSWYTNLRYTF